jgi:mannose/fructose/N-acetylgalactosamine-specific phosphotransferase system component IIB
VDDRLIHGQVVIAWGLRFHPRRIWVADDAAAASPLEREVFEGAAEGVSVRVVSIAAAAEAYAAERAEPGRAFLIVRDLPAALRLVDLGAAVPRWNLGGLHYAPGKQKLNEYVYVDDADRAAARALIARGIELEVQDVPASRATALADLDPLVRTA